MKKLFILISMLICAPAWSGGNVYQKTVDASMDVTYKRVYQQLEENRFYVVFEPNIGSNLSGFAERWGDDYNRSGLTGIRSMVFCNGWYANAVSNADPTMLALCPLHITLTEKEGRTTVLFARPTVIAAGSPAAEIAAEIENKVINALEQALLMPVK
jgi:hypothetical protein